MRYLTYIYWLIWYADKALGAPSFDLKAFGDGINLIDNLFQLQRNAYSINSIITKKAKTDSSTNHDNMSTVTVFQQANNYSDQLNQIIEALDRNQNTKEMHSNFPTNSTMHNSDMTRSAASMETSFATSSNEYMIEIVKGSKTFLYPASVLSPETSVSEPQFVIVTTISPLF